MHQRPLVKDIQAKDIQVIQAKDIYDEEELPEIKQDESSLLAEAVTYANHIIKHSASRLSDDDIDAKSQKLRSRVSYIQHEANKVCAGKHPGFFMQTLIESCKNEAVGNCREFAFLVLDFLDINDFKGTATVCCDKDGNHVFVIADLEKEAYVIDAWNGKFGKKSELESLDICRFISLKPLRDGIFTLDTLKEWRRFIKLYNAIDIEDIEKVKEALALKPNLLLEHELGNALDLCIFKDNLQIFKLLIEKNIIIKPSNFEFLQKKVRSKEIPLSQALEITSELKLSSETISIELLKMHLSEYEEKKGFWRKIRNSETQTIADFKLLLKILEKKQSPVVNRFQVELCLCLRDSRESLLRKSKQLVNNSLNFFRGDFSIDLEVDKDLTETEKFIVSIRTLFNAKKQSHGKLNRSSLS